MSLKKAGKMFNMNSILSTASIEAHWSKDVKMSIEYHLQRPSIGMFLWTIIVQTFGGIKRNDDAFESTRNEFHKEYVLPIGQSLGYDGVTHSTHFDEDYFAPYHGARHNPIYPSIRGHNNSPSEERKTAYRTLGLMEAELVTTAQIVPDLYRRFLKQ